MKYYLGIDGGGTRTTAAVSDEKGNILLKKTGRTINFYSVGMAACRENLAGVIRQITDELGDIRFEAAFIGCSALDERADEKLIDELCSGVIKAEKIGMDSDVFIALKSVGKAVCPCAAICGTGSMAIGEDEAGNTVVTGGWGHVIGDEGSGYSLGVEALKVCCIQCDEGVDSPLLNAANRYFGVDNFREAIDIIYSPETTKGVLAGFAADVGRLAAAGDEQAKAIITQEVLKFSRTVLVLLKKIKACSVLGLYGGIFQHNAGFTEQFTKIIKSHYPALTVKLIEIPPEESAVMLAREMS